MKSWILVLALLATAAPLAHAAAIPATPNAPTTPTTSTASPRTRARGIHFLYLIRHGMYDRDSTVADDRVGNGLNALGHEQAKLIGARLAALPIRLHSLVGSDFTRARQTAEDIGAVVGMTPTLDSLLEECTPPSDRPASMGNRFAADSTRCDAQLEAAWAKYFTPSPDADQHDVLVCHGNVIRSLVARALGLDPRRWGRMDIANASLTILSVRADGSARLVMFSDVGHIPVDKQTWSGVGGGWGKRPG